MSDFMERVDLLLRGREVTIFLPLTLERRLKAQIHRMNAQTLAAGFDDPADQFDLVEDLGSCLMGMVDMGLSTAEAEDGVVYGWDGLPETGSIESIPDKLR